MKLYRVKSFGDTSGLQRREEPKLPAPVARQVLVRIHASSLNYRDLMGLKGILQSTPPGMALSHIPLSDGAGEVVATGSDVSRVKTGDRVALTFHPDWIGGSYSPELNALGRSSGLNDGMLTEYKLVDESELVHLPSHLSFEEAATLPCAGVTAWYALHGPAPLLSGEDVLVLGTGGVSLFALQFAKMAGARVIATTTSPTKMERLWALGADVVIEASNGVEWAEHVLEATSGRGVDVTVEVGGAGTWSQTVSATRHGGRISIVGALSGSKPSGSQFSARGLNLHPTRVGSRQHFEQMNRAIALHKLRPVIDRVFGFDDALKAVEYFQTQQHVGKIVIRHD